MKSLRVIAALAAILLALGLFVPGSAGSTRTAGRGGPSGVSDWKQAVREKVAGLAGRDQSTGKNPRQASPAYDGAEVVPGEFLVKPASGFFAADLETSFSGLGAEVLEDLEPAGLLLVGLPGAPDTGRALEALRSLPTVEAAEPNLLRHFYALPNDSLIGNQWYLDHIGASAAWDVTHGSGSVVIADIDSGIMTTHEDLEPGIESGRILTGYNTMTGTTDVEDDVGHGTWVAGCFSAETDNTLGVAGIGWDCSLLPIKAGDSSGVSLADEIDALYYAADHGADIINMSFGVSGIENYSALEQEAVDYAVEQGCVITAARGNEDHDLPDFPACLQNVIGVGATDESDQPVTPPSGGPTTAWAPTSWPRGRASTPPTWTRPTATTPSPAPPSPPPSPRGRRASSSPTTRP